MMKRRIPNSECRTEVLRVRRASSIRHSAFCIRHLSAAFTLLEVLVAVAIMTATMALVAMIYTNTIKAWRLAQDAMDELHQGDFVIEQLVGALRSEAFFINNPKVYGFWLDDKGTQSSAHDEISFVTSSSAFLPSSSPLQNSLHRMWITIDQDKNGREGLAVRALPHIVKELDKNSVEPWIVSTRVKAFDCQVYDMGKKEWSDSWEDTNKIPNLIKITLTIQPVHAEDQPLVISRVVEIPIANAVTQAVAITAAPGAVPRAGPGAAAPGVGIGGRPGTGQPGPLPTGGFPAAGSGNNHGRQGNNNGRQPTSDPFGGSGGGSTRKPVAPLPPVNRGGRGGA